MDLPIAYKNNMKELLKEEYDSYLASFEKSRLYGLRVNTGKITTERFEEICPFSIKKIPWTKNGYYYEEGETPSKHPYYYAGLYYLQEPSAMLPAEVLPVEEGDKVLDLCAAPGGKATELGTKLKNSGALLANDISSTRAKGLLKNLELFGLSKILVTGEDVDLFFPEYEEYFDKILLDAPCSGEGMFRKDPSLIQNWLEKGPSYYSTIQKELLSKASMLLKPGGMLLYSTCTFSPEENEEVILSLLEADESFSICSIPDCEGFSQGRFEYAHRYPDITKCVRLFPHKINGEGHFVCLLIKKAPDSRTAGKKDFEDSQKADKQSFGVKKNSVKTEKLPEDFVRFLKQLTFKIDEKDIFCQNDKLYLLPDDMYVKKGLRYLRTGLLLGECTKDRFTPSQALAMSLKKEQYSSVISLSAKDNRVIKYLKGETIDSSDMDFDKKLDWQLVCVEEFPLGWAKLSGGILKNKYYPGWRWQS